MELKVLYIAAFLGLAAAKPGLVRRSKLTADLGEKGDKLGIYKGKATTIEKHPYLAIVRFQKMFYCAGAILSDSWVITLGDCTYGVATSDLNILVGSSDGINGTAYKVKNVVTHPKFVYDNFNFYYEYSLLEIKGKFSWSSKVGNISLPSQRLADNTWLKVAGYGLTSFVDGKTLMQGKMKLLPNATCANFNSTSVWRESELCAYNKGKTTMCYNDFGDPFVHNGVLYGIAIGTIGSIYDFCTSNSLPTILSDIYLVKDWVQKHTGAEIAQY